GGGGGPAEFAAARAEGRAVGEEEETEGGELDDFGDDAELVDVLAVAGEVAEVEDDVGDEEERGGDAPAASTEDADGEEGEQERVETEKEGGARFLFEVMGQDREVDETAGKHQPGGDASRQEGGRVAAEEAGCGWEVEAGGDADGAKERPDDDG